MLVKITLLALCLALALPAPAVYTQDDCEELDCESSEETAESEETDPDDSSEEVSEEASAEDAESAKSEEESEESDAPDATQEPDAQAEPASGSDDAAIDEDLTEAETDFSELAQDEAALAADDDADESTPVEGPSDTTPVDPPSEPASPQTPTEPAPAAPASPSVDAVALQSFQDEVANCFLAQAVKVPAGVDLSQHPAISKHLYCYPSDDPRSWGGPELEIQSHTALFSIIGVRYGGDGKRRFQLPRLPDGYCICMHGQYPRRGDPARGEVDENGQVKRELCRLEKIGNPGFSGEGMPGEDCG